VGDGPFYPEFWAKLTPFFHKREFSVDFHWLLLCRLFAVRAVGKHWHLPFLWYITSCWIRKETATRWTCRKQKTMNAVTLQMVVKSSG